MTREECFAGGDEVAVLVGPGHVDSFGVKCLRTAATLIEAPCGQISHEGRVPTGAAAPVVVGDSATTATSGGITFAAVTSCAQSCDAGGLGVLDSDMRFGAMFGDMRPSVDDGASAPAPVYPDAVPGYSRFYARSSGAVAAAVKAELGW